jgi:hypothetical protein
MSLSQLLNSRSGSVARLTLPSGFTQLIPPLSGTLALPRERIQIVQQDLAEIACELGLKDKMLDAGSWSLILDHQAIYPTPLPGAPFSIPICPTRAIVNIGSGGSRNEFETDTKNQVFAMPGQTVTVDVAWDESLPAMQVSGVNSWVLPSEVVITATLQRSFTSNRATRSIWVPQYDPALGGAIQGKVPNLARCVRVWGRREIGATPPDDAQFFLGPAFGYLNFYAEKFPALASYPLMQYRGDTLMNPAGVPVPALAESFYLFVPPLQQPLLGPVEFELGL